MDKAAGDARYKSQIEPVIAAEHAHLLRTRAWRFTNGATSSMGMSAGTSTGTATATASTVARSILFGLALSGGGIRSAAFALGAMHALVRYGKLRWFDYLSSVSGGGYAGSALTWMLSTYKDADVLPNSAAGLGNFPLSAWRQGRKTSANNPAPGFHEMPVRRLDWIRARANYLTPTDELRRRAAQTPRGGVELPRPPRGGLSVLSVIGVVLRAVVVGLSIYLPALFAVLIMIGMGADWLDPSAAAFGSMARTSVVSWTHPFFDDAWARVFAALAVILAAAFALSSIMYALLTRIGGRISYRLRTWHQALGGWLLLFVLACLVMASLPFVIAVTSVWLGSGLTAGGILSGAVHLILRGRAGTKKNISTGTIATVGGLALCYGVLLLGYLVAHVVLSPNDSLGEVLSLPWVDAHPLGVAGVMMGWSLLAGLLMNLNYVTPHRMYRDRLMEAFLPPAPWPRDGFENALPDATSLSDMCGAGQRARKAREKFPDDPQQAQYTGPYHLINANIVLTRSNYEGIRGRGGDAFLLSPLYCGSAATGWYATEHFGAETRFSSNKRTMTLATAMSISGAAANPHTGSNGRGPMRTWPVAFLMNLLHLRLGYVEINPAWVDPMRLGWRKWLMPARPTPWLPGLAHLLGRQLHEGAHFVELSDGGHFENLGLYELFRREVRVIVCTDAGCDPEFGFSDIANAVERARVDFGVNLHFLHGRDLCDTVLPPLSEADNPFTAEAAARGFAIAKIRYAPAVRTTASAIAAHAKASSAEKDAPAGQSKRANEPLEESADAKERIGVLILVKSTLIKGLPPDLYGYRGANRDFPHESTTDQEFDETQFESYRELGYRLTADMLNDPIVAQLLGRLDEDPPAAGSDGSNAIATATFG